MGNGQGLQPVVGTNFGAKQYDRVRQAMKVFCLGGLVLAAIFGYLLNYFRSNFIRICVDASIIAGGVNHFRMFYSVFLLYGVMVMTITFFQAIGDGKKPGKIVMLRQLILFVPAMLLLPKNIWRDGCLVGGTCC